ncbi:glycyl-radical enzyme activating protein [Diplocloster agilis]|uniref:Glycyl-radical enzyme activating protein n=1 Tax=Diplocloster agilis TaxID=2850323 RepID=A0A949NFP1_9FIRM|nr:glycyl-radical enzyme activating protein [Diplocloster agilis]MBU9735408.1 glycyl-radical enzyme activating protein [Diplocloster agilis]
MQGYIFDIKEFAVFDGPGIRTTVFFKGCPLHCMWCHNPEGMSFAPELMTSPNGCLHCGRCAQVCPSPSNCRVCGKCIGVCPMHLRKICGTAVTPRELAGRILKDRDFLLKNEGGVTFSGGEPFAQPEFLEACIRELNGLHACVETSGYCDGEWFRRIVGLLQFVIMDIKLADDDKHRYYTGAGNRKILANLKQLKSGNTPYMIRIPLIPGVNDTKENMEQTAGLLTNAGPLVRVELLPYHKTAGAKYGMVGRSYHPEFRTDQKPQYHLDAFEKREIPYKIM